MKNEKHECRAEVIDLNGSTALLVATPPLPRSVRTNEIAFEGELYAALFAIDVPIIPRKLLWFVHIYPPKVPVLDNDNSCKKRVIDVLTDFLTGGDCGLTCSLRQDSFVSDTLPSGTYILVIPLESEAPTRCEALEIITKWVELHP